METVINYENEINNLISNQKTLKEVGILRISKITLELEELEFKLNESFDKSLKQYVEVSFSCNDNNIIKLMKDKAEEEIKILNTLKILRKKWIYWMTETIGYF
jgi:hypothetical protein